MPQALHIFKKDVRYLWREICLLLTLGAIFAWSQPWWVECLLLVAASFLVARLIHAERIPGDRQFWIARPYHWASLLAAKLLFILVFVNLPIAAAQLGIVIGAGFPLASSLPGFLWSQVLMILCVSLPIASLAAVTSGPASFVFSLLILLVLGFSVQQMLVPPLWPGAIEWIRDSIVVAAMVAVALFVLYMQYRNRRTLFSRAVALSGAVLGAAACVYMPWSPAFAVQSRLSKQVFDASSVHVALDPGSMRFFPLAKPMEQVETDFSIAVSGVPDGADLEADTLAVTFQAPGGRTWKSGRDGFGGLLKNSVGRGSAIFRVSGLMDRSFFDRERGQAVMLRASLYLTLFGRSRARTIPLQEKPVNVMDGLQCNTGVFGDILCRAAFRWPALLVGVKVGETGASSFTRFISYSPFPAGINLNPIKNGWASGTLAGREATFTVKEPLAHFRRDLEIRNVRFVASDVP